MNVTYLYIKMDTGKPTKCLPATVALPITFYLYQIKINLQT